MTTLRLLLLLALFSTVGLVAQSRQESGEERPYIEVTGRSEMKVVPDQIHIAIELKERGSGDKKITVERQELDLKEAVKSLGLDAANLSLSDAIADYVPKKFRKDEVVARKAYELMVADAEMVRKVFSELDRLEIEDARIDRVSHSKEVEFRKEQRIKAIQEAKEKADDLLAAIGEKTGGALVVKEGDPERTGNGQAIRAHFDFENQMKLGYAGAYEPMSVSFSRITITEAVYAKFGITPR